MEDVAKGAEKGLIDLHDTQVSCSKGFSKRHYARREYWLAGATASFMEARTRLVDETYLNCSDVRNIFSLFYAKRFLA
eukprot:15354783-Ditylum_brightwellii.AAC.2